MPIEMQTLETSYVSEGSKTLFRNWVRGHSCYYIMGKRNPRTLAAFCSGAELKSGGLRSVVVEMSRQIASEPHSGCYPLLYQDTAAAAYRAGSGAEILKMGSLPRNRVRH